MNVYTFSHSNSSAFLHKSLKFLLSLLWTQRHVAMLSIVARREWGARDAKLVETFSGPIPFVIIHHSFIPRACYTEEACEASMRKMQDMHQNIRGWNDIGYSFAIGGDGRIYHGRGYNVIGAHAPRYNDKSIGICLIGDWTSIDISIISAAQRFQLFFIPNKLSCPRMKCWQPQSLSSRTASTTDICRQTINYLAIDK